MKRREIWNQTISIAITCFSILSCGESTGTERGYTFGKKGSEIRLSDFSIPISATAVGDKIISVTWNEPADLDGTADVIIEIKDPSTLQFREAELGATPKVSQGYQSVEKMIPGIMLLPETVYAIRARVRVGSELSAYSPEVSATTMPSGQSIWSRPTSISAIAGVSRISLSWGFTLPGNFDGFEKIELLRSINGGPFLPIATKTTATQMNVLTLEDTNISALAVYKYKIRITYLETITPREFESAESAGVSKLTALSVPTISSAEEFMEKSGAFSLLQKVTIEWTQTARGLNGHNGFEIDIYSASSNGGGFAWVQTIPIVNPNASITTVSRDDDGLCLSHPEGTVKMSLRATSTRDNASAVIYTGEFACQIESN